MLVVKILVLVYHSCGTLEPLPCDPGENACIVTQVAAFDIGILVPAVEFLSVSAEKLVVPGRREQDFFYDLGPDRYRRLKLRLRAQEGEIIVFYQGDRELLVRLYLVTKSFVRFDVERRDLIGIACFKVAVEQMYSLQSGRRHVDQSNVRES